MLDFDLWISRHGEGGLLFLVEQMELAAGVVLDAETPLEERWIRLVQREAGFSKAA